MLAATFDLNGVAVAVYLGTELANASQRAGAVLTAREVVEFGSAIGNRGQHRVTMRDGFVSRKTDRAKNIFCRRDRDHSDRSQRIAENLNIQSCLTLWDLFGLSRIA